MYFNIQRFSTHDGDGIRSILFLKGCTLGCPWCQNPESRSPDHSILYDQRLCMAECRLCQDKCNAIQRDDPNGPIAINRDCLSSADIESLRDICPSQALSVCGKEETVDELCEQLLKDKPFYEQSGGGVTFSGGEPLLQPDLVAQIAQRMHHEGINTAVETCLHVPWNNIETVLPHIDCWLTDLKHTDSDLFLSWAHGSLKRIQSNFQRLAKQAKRIIIRVPVVPDFNDNEQALEKIIDFAASLDNCDELHLLPYHTLGINKYQLLDMPYLCADKPLGNADLLEAARAYAKSHPVQPITVKIRG